MIPSLTSLFAETWSIADETFSGLQAFSGRRDLLDVIVSMRRHPAVYRVQSGVAIVSLMGIFAKNLDDAWYASVSLSDVHRQLKLAVRDPKVGAAMLLVDSPGGQWAGTHQTAESVRDLAKQKPTFSYFEDQAVGGACLIGCQAGKVFMNRAGSAGGLGLFNVTVDSYERAKKNGLKVHVLRGGEFKGAGTPGTLVTAPQLAEFQRRIDDLYSHYVDAVAAGRRISRATALAVCDGRQHVGQAAIAVGLVDRICDLDDAFTEAVTAANSHLQKGNS